MVQTILTAVFLAVMAGVCYASTSKKPKAKKTKTADKAVTQQVAMAVQQEPDTRQPVQLDSPEDLYFGEDFDINDLINAGKDSKQ